MHLSKSSNGRGKNLLILIAPLALRSIATLEKIGTPEGKVECTILSNQHINRFTLTKPK